MHSQSLALLAGGVLSRLLYAWQLESPHHSSPSAIFIGMLSASDFKGTDSSQDISSQDI
ncbi:hypothetical protein [Acaryochloris sp. IP29b_bin.137]|uniref:hypothetical protein n=1 Tax=Acaryochloris sp. IP29b_bin.137 TaxID=2969217 RepID=UPI00262FFB0C|nr:hypothetical protein [Acaryochloris sp. IP29b_bin.137]